MVRDLASQGQYHFSTDEAQRELGGSIVAVRSALRRLKRKSRIVSPYRGFHVILPAEYQHLGCLPADQFVPQLLERLAVPYYAGLLTAGRYHGAAHQQPQTFHALVPKNRPPIFCGDVTVRFVARHNTAQMPTVRLNTPRGYVVVSTPETTAFDLVGYPHYAGGLDNVATVLSELAERLEPDRLASIAPLSPLPWAQRLGYLLDLVGERDLTDALARHITDESADTVPLALAGADGTERREPRWRLLVNARVEPDL